MTSYIVFVPFVPCLCRVVVLESHLCQEVTRGGTLNEDGADLYILAGHEASYWRSCKDGCQCCEFSVVSYWLCMKCTTDRFVGNISIWTSNIVTGTCDTLKVGLTWNWNTASEYHANSYLFH
jgi:hypothetical protein